MDVLLRELGTGERARDFQDRELTGDVITIGSAPDQSLQLIGADILGRHARLSAGAGVVTIEALGKARLKQEGAEVKKVSLSNGQSVFIGGHRLTVISAPSGFSAALELVRDTAADNASFERAYQTRLADTWLSKRAPAWVLFFAVLVIGLGIPLWLVLDGDPKTPAADSRLFTSAIWSSGPLHAVHQQSIGDNCAACHDGVFTPVRNEACTECHTLVRDHVQAVAGAGAALATDHSAMQACTDCHQEHDEPSQLVVSADTLCSDCHATPPDANAANPHLRAVSGFEAEAHPDFEVVMPVPGDWSLDRPHALEWSMVETSLGAAKEKSNLKFPHAVHIAGESVRTAAGESLGCSDCHTLRPDREHFEPVAMATHCRECHELTFDANAPDRQLPHGLPDEAISIMEAHYIRTAGAAPQVKSTSDRRERRRRPNQAHQPSAAAGCSGSAMQCAAQRTAQEAENQFTRSGCVSCHEVEDTGDSDIYQRFKVLPVKLSHNFMPSARFDHLSHMTQANATGDQACLTCHQAEASEQSAEVLIPDLGTCLDCHADQEEADKVVLQCVDCHGFHPLQGEELLLEARAR